MLKEKDTKDQLNYLVTKSNQLVQANYKLTTTEQKIILYLVSRIKKEDEDFKMYELPIKKFCEMLGVKGNPRYTEIKKITQKLMEKVLEIEDKDGITQLHWVTKVRYSKNAGTVSLSFHPDMREHLLQLRREFTSYRIANVLGLKSGHSIRLYELLKQWETRKTVTYDIQTLVKRLGLSKTYATKYSNFKMRVVSVAQNELKEKTDLSFEYEEVKQGRKVIGLTFSITSKKLPFHEEQLNFFENEEDVIEHNPLYFQINEMTKKYNYLVDDSVVERWERLAKEKWKNEGDIHNKLLFLIDEVSHKKEIDNKIGYITTVLKTSDSNFKDKSTKSPIRKEMKPQWFESRPKPKAQEQRGTGSKFKDIYNEKEKFEELISKFKA